MDYLKSLSYGPSRPTGWLPLSPHPLQPESLFVIPSWGHPEVSQARPGVCVLEARVAGEGWWKISCSSPVKGDVELTVATQAIPPVIAVIYLHGKTQVPDSCFPTPEYIPPPWTRSAQKPQWGGATAPLRCQLNPPSLGGTGNI